MSLLDEIKSHQPRLGARCAFEYLVPSLTPNDADDLAEALADPSVTGTAIAKALAARGHKITAASIQRHRRGGCSCESR